MKVFEKKVVKGRGSVEEIRRMGKLDQERMGQKVVVKLISGVLGGLSLSVVFAFWWVL